MLGQDVGRVEHLPVLHDQLQCMRLHHRTLDAFHTYATISIRTQRKALRVANSP
jgi:hypothetical protein